MDPLSASCDEASKTSTGNFPSRAFGAPCEIPHQALRAGAGQARRLAHRSSAKPSEGGSSIAPANNAFLLWLTTSFLRRRMKTRHGFTLLEIMPVLVIVAMLATIVLVSLNPLKQFGEARNAQRRGDITYIADAIVERTRDDATRALFLRIATGSAIEICGDSLTGSCAGLLDIRELVDDYLLDIPLDPLSEDPDTLNEHTLYFIQRGTQRFTITASGAEPVGVTSLSISR